MQVFSEGYCPLKLKVYVLPIRDFFLPGSVDKINDNIMVIIVMIMTMETIIKLDSFI
jgi:hypothetical protein